MLRAAGGLICGLAFGAFLLVTSGMEGSGRYPFAYSQVLIAGIALLFLVSAARDWREARAFAASHPDAEPRDLPGGTLPMLATVALCIVYAAAWPLLGFLLSTFLYVAAQLWLLRQREWGFMLGVPVAVTLLVYVIFARLLLLPFPHGALFGD